MRRSTMERREIAVASRRNDKRIAHAASLIGLAATALERAAGDLSAAHGDDGMSLTDPADVVLEEAVHISKLAADIESHMNAPRPAQRGPRSVTRYTCVMN